MFKMSKTKVPGRLNGDASVYKKSATRTRESKYRDVYKPRDVKRGNQREITSKRPIYFFTAIVGVILAIGLPFITGGLVFVYNFVINLFAGKFVQPNYWSGLGYALTHFWWMAGTFIVWAGLLFLTYMALNDNWKVENISADNSDINDYENDAMLQEPEALAYNYDIAPDSFAHYSGDVTAILSHQHFTNKGLKPWKSGQKIFDQTFSDKLFDSDKIPDDPNLRIRYNAKEIAYNPNHEFGKPDYATVADVIDKTWTLPEYENGRPGGAYIVDTSPSNSMIIASTRAGKGQTYIEPIIDTWTRAKEQQNIVINDPKGELYVKFFYPMRKRGMDTIVFNLLDSTHTNIYNPLGYAVQAARQGDFGKMEDFINNVGGVFFPTEGADDPMWPNAAAATFKRSVLGLIDYYIEEEAEMRNRSVEEKWSADLLARRLDEMWGRVTLYNTYQMMVSLAAKKSSDTSLIQFEDEEAVEEKDYLSLFFDATERLPQNPLRKAAINNNRTLRTMAGSDKTIASVYGIAMSTMLFFTDGKISSLTSGRPSQNFDMEGLSFPRRFGVRFDKDYTLKQGLNSQNITWTVYHDKMFQDQYKDKDFIHEGVIQNGWSRAYFKGKFEEKVTYLKMVVSDRDSHLKLKTYYFKFTKDLERNMSGKKYIKDPVTKEFVVKDGTLVQLQRVRNHKTNEVSFIEKDSLIPYHRKNLQTVGFNTEIKGKKMLFPSVDVHYSERTKGIFLVTPPSKMQYSKLILIMLSQAFDVNVEASYISKGNQKPLYKTKYILDEFGNLQSEGKGIPFLQTKESIGLGQDQQYTLILQTLQQLRDVYGDSIDKILQGNTANIIYLKSNDDSMLDTLIGLGGVRHESRQSSKNFSTHLKSLPGKSDGSGDSVSYTISTSEVPVISKNDMLFIQQGNAMTFRLGENPIWSKNQLAMPFAYALHAKLFKEAPKYSLLTVPTPSNTDEFQILENIPDWTAMVEKRVRQAKISLKMMERYQDAYGLGPDDLQKLDSELVSIDVMEAVNEQLHLEDAKRARELREVQEQAENYENNRSEFEVDADEIDFANDDDDEPDEIEDMSNSAQIHTAIKNFSSNEAALNAGKSQFNNSKMNEVMIGDSRNGSAVTRYEFRNSGHSYDDILSKAYDENRNAFSSVGAGDGWQVTDNGELYHNGILMFRNVQKELEDMMANSDVKVVDDDDLSNPDIKWEPTVEFMDYVVSGNVFRDMIDGRFARTLRRLYEARN